MTDRDYEAEHKAETEALPGLEERAKKLLVEVGIKDTTVKSLTDQESWPSCGCVEFGDTGIGIYITHYDKPAIVWDDWNEEKGGTVRALGYQVYSTSYDPGVRYYPDGSGEPPSTDINDEGEVTGRMDDAITEAIVLVAKMRIGWLQEHEADEAMDQCLAEYCADLAAAEDGN